MTATWNVRDKLLVAGILLVGIAACLAIVLACSGCITMPNGSVQPMPLTPRQQVAAAADVLAMLDNQLANLIEAGVFEDGEAANVRDMTRQAYDTLLLYKAAVEVGTGTTEARTQMNAAIERLTAKKILGEQRKGTRTVEATTRKAA